MGLGVVDEHVRAELSLADLNRLRPAFLRENGTVTAGNASSINDGAIALGHPSGARGAILTVKLLYELQRTGGRYGLVTLCIGGGQGIPTGSARGENL